VPHRGRLSGLAATLAALVLIATPARAETLGDVLAALNLSPPPGAVPLLDRPLARHRVLDDARDVLVVYALADGDASRLHATRLDKAAKRWTTVPIDIPPARGVGGPQDIGADSCQGGLALERYTGGFLLIAHINPSAECTIVLGPALEVRAVLAGWPVLSLPGGRIVYQRNQVHFASFHPVALGLFDPARPGDMSLYPRKPYQSARAAHVERMRGIYTDAWCRAHNHPCDPELFDESVTSPVVSDTAGDTLAFVIAWEGTAGASDAERPRARTDRPGDPTEVVYVYVGVRQPATMRYRELTRQEFEARFGSGLPRRALAPDVLRSLFGAARGSPPSRR
jgi:hypothetical protein